VNAVAADPLMTEDGNRKGNGDEEEDVEEVVVVEVSGDRSEIVA
jgi:hypothetical protein